MGRGHGDLAAGAFHLGQDVSSVAFLPDGTWLATGSVDGTVTIWDDSSWAVVRNLDEPEWGVFGLQFSPDGAVLVSMGDDEGTTRTWASR